MIPVTLWSIMEIVALRMLYLFILGAALCRKMVDTVTFGGITMEHFIFGSCYEQVNLFYPERYFIFFI